MLALAVLALFVIRAWAADSVDSTETLPALQSTTVVEQPSIGADEDTHLNKTPPRATKGLDLVKLGWSYNCMECHQTLEPQWTTNGRIRVEHESIELKHGNNRFCLNCHHTTNRNAFTDYDGSEIAEQNVVSLCARCHGPVHRDWQAGVHGRKNGFWDKSKGPQTQLRCIQCHDPHDPKFKGMHPLTPPHYPARAAGSQVFHPATEGGH